MLTLKELYIFASQAKNYKFIMRKFLFVIVALFMTVSVEVSSQNVMTAHLKTGQIIDFAFINKPVVSFTENEAVFTTTVDGESVVFKYDISALSKFTFSTKDLNDLEGPDAVVQVENDRVRILIDGYSVTVTGAQAEQTVSLILADGTVAAKYRTDKDGTASFSVADIPVGMYIVACQDIAFKILKK